MRTVKKSLEHQGGQPLPFSQFFERAEHWLFIGLAAFIIFQVIRTAIILNREGIL